MNSPFSFNRHTKTSDSQIQEAVDEHVTIIIKKDFDYLNIETKVQELTGLEHNTICDCNGNWSICCENSTKYPELLLCDECLLDSSINYKRDYTLSPAPSPHRDDNDWYISHDNPLYQELMCDISLRGSSPRKMKVSYLEDCLQRYYNLN